jgi:formate-dependent nitrite reductase cytochrome c552 subunit
MQMKNGRILTYAALIWLASATGPGGSVAAQNECVNCHSNPDYFAQQPKLHEYYQDWLTSPHKQAGATCDDCHGGDPRATAKERAHAGVLGLGNPESALHYLRQPATCGKCHADKRAQFTQSKHFEALAGQRAAPTCTTCHPAMNRRPSYRLIVLNACRNCHGEGNSENLPLVSEQATNVFHQLNVASGLLGWANIYYESLGWPEASEEHMRGLGKRYEAILNDVHRFDLARTETEIIAIQAELREIFDAARNAEERRREQASDDS